MIVQFTNVNNTAPKEGTNFNAFTMRNTGDPLVMWWRGAGLIMVNDLYQNKQSWAINGGISVGGISVSVPLLFYLAFTTRSVRRACALWWRGAGARVRAREVVGARIARASAADGFISRYSCCWWAFTGESSRWKLNIWSEYILIFYTRMAAVARREGQEGKGGITVVGRRGYVFAHSVGRERSSSSGSFYAQGSYI